MFSRSACGLLSRISVREYRLDRTASSFIVNDTYRTDIHLVYPPYVIALAALYIGFCMTQISNTSGTRTRSSAPSQTQTRPGNRNADLGIGSPPTSAAEFIASFEVSLPVLLACVQDIIVLYPIWEDFEPSLAPRIATIGTEKSEKFGVYEAEALVRRMIEERMVDVGHPDNAGRTDESTPQIGRKRHRT